MFGTTQDETVYVYGLRGHAFRSADLGETWETVDTGTVATLLGGTWTADGEAVFVGHGNVVLACNDDTLSCRLASTGGRRGITGVAEAARRQLVTVGQGGARVLR